VHFTVIVNPHSGPGEDALPNANYTEAIATLNLLDNVRTIGYVATTWCTKNVSLVLDEISVYAEWGLQNPSLALHGIFFDETVTQYSTDYVHYLRTVSEAVRSSDGLADGFVVHNPGAMPDAQYIDDPTFEESVDLTVVFEDSYHNWVAKSASLAEKSSAYEPTALSCMVHSVPTLSDKEMNALLQDIIVVGRIVYLTSTNDYTSFDSYFPVLVDCLDNLHHRRDFRSDGHVHVHTHTKDGVIRYCGCRTEYTRHGNGSQTGWHFSSPRLPGQCVVQDTR
jgi:hypothetical protein